MKSYRILEEKLKNHFNNYKQILILLGARQVGKTTLIKRLFPEALYLLVDESSVKQTLETYSSDIYKKLILNHKQIFIDEIHLLSDPGRAVKILYDQIKDLQIIISGSSSLHIKNKTSESLAGRAINYNLHPLTFWESLYQMDIEKEEKPISITKKLLACDSSKTIKIYPINEMLQLALKYGLYPEILNINLKEEYLSNLVEKAIFKDIVELNLIENRAKALDLLKTLAYQIGNIINYAELSRKLQLSILTVQRYIEIFEQSYILYRLFPFSKNKRDEIGKSPKIYFWDLGLRNGLIKNFDNINIRNDAGAMFENFIISEVKKEVDYYNYNLEINYWRTKSDSKVDLVLSDHNNIYGIELKLNKGKITEAFTNRYPKAKTVVINSGNFI